MIFKGRVILKEWFLKKEEEERGRRFIKGGLIRLKVLGSF